MKPAPLPWQFPVLEPSHGPERELLSQSGAATTSGGARAVNSSRVWLERELCGFASRLPQGARVLDAGAGNQPYKGLFRHCRYEAADFEKVDKKYAQSTYVCDLSRIPVASLSYDASVLSQVLEHTPEPFTVLEELRRVLRPGGLLFYSGPFFYEEHEVPYDFYRYTQYGVRYLLQKAGFLIERIEWLEGYACTVAYQLETIARRLPRDPRSYGGGLAGVGASAAAITISALARRSAQVLQQADMQRRIRDVGFPKNYYAIAKKM